MRQEFNEKNRDLLINIDGVLKHRDEAVISPFDSDVQGGDAVWEGLRVYDGRIGCMSVLAVVDGTAPLKSMSSRPSVTSTVNVFSLK